tara:strand:+ start:245 stop:418 length:174 start_codon:yes stop_codon:yes gene_type:complete
MKTLEIGNITYSTASGKFLYILDKSTDVKCLDCLHIDDLRNILAMMENQIEAADINN